MGLFAPVIYIYNKAVFAYDKISGNDHVKVYNQIRNKSYQGAKIPEITSDYSSLFAIYQKLPRKDICRAEQTLRDLKTKMNLIKEYGPCEKYASIDDKLKN